MPVRLLAWVVAAVFAFSHVAWAQEGLVAHWDFGEGKGEVLRDKSGNGNDGVIHGATWVTREKGNALRFDGQKDYVDCGNAPSLDIRRAITLEAWVYAEVLPEGEPAILGKGFSSYILSFYRSGLCSLYISSGANQCSTPLPTGAWSHVAATFDGTALRVYINGVLASVRISKNKEIRSDGNLMIGRSPVIGAEYGPAFAKPGYFKGMISDVRVYSSALPEDKIREQYQQMADAFAGAAAAPFARIKAASRMDTGAFAVQAGERGALEIEVAGDAYIIESSFSYPGAAMGTNWLSETPRASEPAWRPRIVAGQDGMTLKAEGEHYLLERRIILRQGKIEIADTLSNKNDAPLGVLVQHLVTARDPFKDSCLTSTAENPTLLLLQPQSRLGILAEDSVSRVQMTPLAFSNQAGYALRHFALPARKSYTLRWTLYPLPKTADYWTLINRVRDDWKANFTIPGPIAFTYESARVGLVHNAERLKADLQRRKIRVFKFVDPWLDYHTGQDLTRDQYKLLLQTAQRKLKAADPEVNVLGNIETDWVPLRPQAIPGFERLPIYEEGKSYAYYLTPAQTRIIEDAGLPWKDSYKRNAEGMLRTEVYEGRRVEGSQVVPGGLFSAVAVYPEVGNYQYKFLMDQVAFLLDEVGLDGVYIDEFSQYRCYSYDKWDGVTVDIDGATGRIERQYTDCCLAGIRARTDIAQAVFSRGKIMVANTCAAVSETQSLPISRFLELPLSQFNPSFLKDGEKPPRVSVAQSAHLGSPLGLGIGMLSWTPATGKNDLATGLMKGIITFLRNGLLYVHYDPTLPQTGQGSGEYGPINHMFPVTPLRLFEGGVEGKERTITCVSGAYVWNQERPPRILLFDSVGREKAHDMKAARDGAGWKVDVKLRDWAEIAVLEQE